MNADEALGLIAGGLAGHRRVGVAFSGGVDSSVLLAAVARILGAPNAIAILGVSPSLAGRERQAAHRVASVIGVRVVEVTTDEASRADYLANGPDRCFHCKSELFERIWEQVKDREALDAIAYGDNADDVLRRDRPGARAADEWGVLRPLAQAGLTKADVRALAHEWGLPCADKPAAPCLASRIPHFSPVTQGKLEAIERAEAGLHDLGLAEIRVRHHGSLARVEVAAPQLPQALQAPMHESILRVVQEAGFAEVIVDPAGLQSGAFTMRALGATDD